MQKAPHLYKKYKCDTFFIFIQKIHIFVQKTIHTPHKTNFVTI
jgi:hypothetical protein